AFRYARYPTSKNLVIRALICAMQLFCSSGCHSCLTEGWRPGGRREMNLNRQNTAYAAAEPTDARTWIQILARYREPARWRSVIELAITVVPLLLLWIAMWATLYFGYYWLSLLIAVPAAGFLVRLFMIQHDCGHGAFFRHRLAND